MESAGTARPPSGMACVQLRLWSTSNCTSEMVLKENKEKGSESYHDREDRSLPNERVARTSCLPVQCHRSLFCSHQVLPNPCEKMILGRHRCILNFWAGHFYPEFPFQEELITKLISDFKIIMILVTKITKL